jgi:hypothetical protein
VNQFPNLGLAELIIITVIIGLPLITLLDLRNKKLSGVALGIWVLIVCAIPVLGPLAYWIIRPSAET